MERDVKRISVFVAISLAVLLSGCTEKGKDAVQTSQQPADPHAGLDVAGGAPTGSVAPVIVGGNRGTIKQILQAGSYTYVEVDMAGRSVWLASNHAEVKVGQAIAWKEGAVMRNFNSKILNRQFEAVMFVSAFLPADAQLQPAGKTGVVRSTLISAGYSYLEVDSEEGPQWLALPTKSFKVGDRIRWVGGSLMQNFHSSSLNRDFDRIWFITSAEVIG